ncbi:BEN domain-containing protein 5, partial [Cyphomyrmex costatus]
VYLGHDVWITNCQYDSIVNVSKTCSIFVKNLAIAVFGTPILKASSVTGTVSNRTKDKKNEKARPKLDPAKMLAVKGTNVFI